MKCNKITMDCKDNGNTIQIIFEGRDVILKHTNTEQPLFIDEKTLAKINAIKEVF